MRHDQRTLAAAAQRQPEAVVLALDADLRQFRRHAKAVRRDVVGQTVLDLDDGRSVAVQENALHVVVGQADGRDTVDLMDAIAGRQEIGRRSERTDRRDDRCIGEIGPLGEHDAHGGGIVARQRDRRVCGAAIGGQTGVLGLGR